MTPMTTPRTWNSPSRTRIGSKLGFADLINLSNHTLQRFPRLTAPAVKVSDAAEVE